MACYKELYKYENRYFIGKINGHLTMSLLVINRALVDESGMNRTQKGMHNRSEIVAVYGTPSAIPPHNSNNLVKFLLPYQLYDYYFICKHSFWQ
jgi:hypothetical protein